MLLRGHPKLDALCSKLIGESENGIPPRPSANFKIIKGFSLLRHLQSGGRATLQRPDPFLVFKHSKPMAPHDATIIQGDLKWIRSLSINRGYLFNLRTDIGESRDLSGEFPDKAKAMDKALMNYLRRYGWTPSMVKTKAGNQNQKK